MWMPLRRSLTLMTQIMGISCGYHGRNKSIESRVVQCGVVALPPLDVT